MNLALTPGTPWVRAWWVPALVVAVALALGHAVRFMLVEPSEVALACDAAPWSNFTCSSRRLTVWAFAQHGLGWAALALAASACLLTAKGTAASLRATITLAALALGSLGLVLYNADPSAWAVTLAIMARAWQHRQAMLPKPTPRKRP